MKTFLHLLRQAAVFRTFCLINLILVGGSASAANIYWNAQTGKWENAANWRLFQVPGVSDNAYIDNGGSALVDGSSPEASINSLFVGDSGTGVLNLTGGGTATSASGIYLGWSSGSSGTVTVDGTDSELENTNGSLYVGYSGTGVLNLTDGGKATSAGIISLGYWGGSSGTVTVDGTNSLLENTAGTLRIGDSGTGVLNLTGGGTATSVSNIFLGFSAGSGGTVTVGNGSEFTSMGNIYVGGNVGGTGGKGLLAGTGTVTAGGATGVRVYNTGTLSPGDTPGAIGTLNITGNLDLQAGATLHIDFNNDGNVAGTNHDLIDVDGNVTVTGRLNISLSSLANNLTGARTIVTATGNIINNGADNRATPLLNGLSLAGSRAADGNDDVTLWFDNVNNHIVLTGATFNNNQNKLLTWTGANGNDWDISTENWTGEDTKFLDGDAVTFANTADATIDIQGTQKVVARMLVTGSGDLTVNGNILGDDSQSTLHGNPFFEYGGQLRKTGTGTLTLNGTGRFVSDITLDGGTTNLGAGSALNSGNLLYVGYDRTGVLNLTGGGKATSASNIYLGHGYGSSGTVTVDGTGSELKSGNYLYVGDTGTGVLNLTDGGKATATSTIYLGFDDDSSGTVTVGSGSELKSGSTLIVGYNGTSTGVLNLTGGGKATSASNIYLGTNTGSSGTVTVDGNGSELKNESNNLVVGNSGTGVLNLTGGGKATSASSIYLGWSFGSSGTVTVGSGSTLTSTGGNIYVGGGSGGTGGTGLLAGTGMVSGGIVRVYNTGALSAGDNFGEIGTLNITGNLELQTASMLKLDIGDAANDKIAVSGDVTVGSGVKIDVAASKSGTFGIVTSGSAIADMNFGDAVITATSTVDGYDLAVRGGTNSVHVNSTDNKILELTLGDLQNKTLTWTGDVNDKWSASATDLNWTDNPGGTATEKRFRNGDSVVFDDTATRTTVYVNDNGVTVNTMTVSDDYVFTGGTVTASNGATVEAGGALRIGDGGATGMVIGDIELQENAALVFNRSDDVNYNETISGEGTVTHVGGANKNSTLTLSGTNTYSGGTILGGGGVSISSVNALGSGAIAFTGDASLRADANGMTLAPAVTIADGKTATFNTQGNTFTLAGTIRGLGGASTLEKTGSGRLLLTHVNTGMEYTNTLVTGGTLEAYYVQALGANGVNLVAAGSLLDFNLQIQAGETYAGQITGNGSVYVRNTSAQSNPSLTLTHADNSYTGGTTVEAGSVLAITHAAHGANAGSVGAGNIVLKAGTSRLEIQLAENGELANDISGAGWLNMDSPGKILTLSGDNIHTGGVKIVNGSVVIGSATALGSGDAVLAGTNGSSLISNREQKIANTIRVTGTGTVLQATEHLTVAGTSTPSSSLYLEAGSLTVNADGANILAETDVEAVSGTTLTKTGTGTFQVSANSVDFSGTLNVNEGDFRVVDGRTFGNSTNTVLNVGADGAISGNGVFRGDMATIGGTIDPTDKKFASNGAETGGGYSTLWLRYGTVALDGATLAVDIASASSYDKIDVDGDVTVGSGLNLNVTASETGTFGIVTSGSAIADTNLNSAVITGTVDGYDLAVRGGTNSVHVNLIDDRILELTLGDLQNKTLTWTGAVNGNWSTSATDLNWTDIPGGEATEKRFRDGDSVIFDDTATRTTVYVNDGGLTVNTMTVNDDYVFTGGAVTASNGATVEAGGALRIGDGGTTGMVIGDIELQENAALVFNRSDDVNCSETISGEGTVTHTGNSTLTLSGTNTYSGTTTVNAGTLNLQSDLTSSDVRLNSGATLKTASGIAVKSIAATGGTIRHAGALTVDNGLILDGTTLIFSAVNGTLSNPISTGSLSLANTNIDVDFSDSGNYTLITATGGIPGTVNLTVTFNGGAFPAGVTAEVKTEGNNLVLTITNSGIGVTNPAASGASISIYPNPAQSGQTLNIVVEMPEKQLEKAVVEIISSRGVIMLKQNLTGKMTELALPASIGSGTYFVRVYSEGFEETVKVVVN